MVYYVSEVIVFHLFVISAIGTTRFASMEYERIFHFGLVEKATEH